MKKGITNMNTGTNTMRITPKELACLFIFAALACLAEDTSVSSGTNDNLRIATRIAHKQYGSNCTLIVASQRKAILAKFQRLNGWGEMKYLLVEMPDPFNLRVVPLQEFGGNGGEKFNCPKEELDPLFQEESWKQLGKYGTLFTMDAFAPTPASAIDFPKKLVGTVAKYALQDRAGHGRDKEWKSVYYTLQPMNIEHYEFRTNARGRLGMTVRSCSIFMDAVGILIYSMPDDIMYAD